MRKKSCRPRKRARPANTSLFLQLRDQVAAQTHRLLQTGEVLAQLDVLASLADLAVSRQYVRPELCDEPILAIREGRHPVLDQTLPAGTFVPNDVMLGSKRRHVPSDHRPEHGRQKHLYPPGRAC